MIIFPQEETFEGPEVEGANQGTLPSLEARCQLAGVQKSNEPLHRNKRLRGWPTERVRKEIYVETMSQETGRPPDRVSLEQWRSKKAEELWKQISENIDPEEQKRVLYEFAVCHVAKLIANTIHLEKMYTTLKPIGQRQWELSSDELKALTDENSLQNLMEVSKEKAPKKIPEWVKGAIIYLSLQSSRRGMPDLCQKAAVAPEVAALKSAAEWCLGNHLKHKGEFQSLEQTTEIFEKWQGKRQKVNMHIAHLTVDEIPKEEEVNPVLDNKGNVIPWLLGWKILPIMEEEIRELSQRILENEAAMHALGESFRKQVMDRWINGIVRRAYIRSYENRPDTGVGTRWRNRAIIFNPVDSYINNRMESPSLLRTMAKTETAWHLLTEDLPEETV